MANNLIKFLTEADGFVSGQEIADKLGISRNSVWKAVNKARKSGFEIEAVPNRGYRVVSREDVFCEEELRDVMKTKWLGAGDNLVFMKTVDSTNTECKRRSENGAGNGLLVITDSQTSGKGRRGREWKTPECTNVAMSYLLKPDFIPDIAPMLTLVMAMAAAKGIAEVTGLDVKIKWPNDIVINGKKVVGILTEMALEEDTISYVIIGTGINVNTTEFPEEISKTATSLYIEAGNKKISRAKIAAASALAFEEYYAKFQETEDLSALEDEYNAICVNVGRRVRVLDPKGEYEADSKGINSKGELMVTKDDGTSVNVYAGEVSVRGVYGYT